MKYWITCAASLLVAFLSHTIPARQMPLDYHAMITVSIPLAVVWGYPVRFMRVAFQKTRTVANRRSTPRSVVARLDDLQPFPALLLLAQLHLIFKSENPP